MDEVKLLPCPTPWCAVPEPYVERVGAHLYKAKCKYCNVETEPQYNLQTAINVWNTRTDEVVERVEWEISAWAFAHNVDGAIRNDLMARIRQAIAAMPAIDQDGGEQAFRDGLLAAEKMVRRFMGEHYGENSALMIDVDAGVQADKPTLAYVAESLARRAAKTPPAQPENDQCQD